MTYTYYGHSCFALEFGGTRLLFDPFITPNDLAKDIVKIDEIAADFILISHGHQDHIADAVQIAKQTDATVIAAWEVCEWLGTQGVTNRHPMNTGGKWDFGTFTIKCVVAQHSSGLPDGTYGGNPMGFLIGTDEGDVYYSGDTALTLDMQLIPMWTERLSAAILPIGDNFTMDYQDAIMASNFVQCDRVIAVHYDTFGFIKVNHEDVKEAFAESGKIVEMVEIGKSIRLDNEE